ncbi:MAG TPA: ISNCY family transposase [Methanosarcina sp.]|nr:ISNCY family transposase [Methanosarcina sp.]
MVTINLNLNNFSELPTLMEVFSSFDNSYEYTAEGVFRRKVSPFCHKCNSPMVHNGYNTYTKKGLGDIKIGRYKCPNCNCMHEENRGFWESLKSTLSDSLGEFFKLLRSYNVSHKGISAVMDFIFPRSKSTILREFNSNMEQEKVSRDENVRIVCYDEQHPKKGRCQKFRLNLLDPKTQKPLADELFDDKSPETIKSFLKKYLNTSEPVFIVTDFDKRYPDILKEVFGDNLIHQYCLMHLNKLVVRDFPRKTTIKQELLKYRILNIFYNREKEIEFLEELLCEESRFINDEKTYVEWIKNAKKQFNQYRHELKLERRRKKENLSHHSLEKAKNNFRELMRNIRTYDEAIQKRLLMINSHWLNLTVFYYLPGTPATNNPVESYFSKSLKTDSKRQFRTDAGIENQIKLTEMKRAGKLTKPNISLLELFRRFTPFKT